MTTLDKERLVLTHTDSRAPERPQRIPDQSRSVQPAIVHDTTDCISWPACIMECASCISDWTLQRRDRLRLRS
jgi:hypothetical protein